MPHEPRLDMNEGPKLGSGNSPVNVHNWVVADADRSTVFYDGGLN